MCGLQKREFPFFAAAALGSVLFTHGLSGVSICFIVISCLIGQWSGKELLNSNPFFEPHMLNEIPIILIASKEQQEAEQNYYQNALGFGNSYIFAENHEEANPPVAGNRGVLIDEEFQESHHNMDFTKKIPLMRHGIQMTKSYCLFWKVENDSEKIQRFARILKSKFT